MKECSVESSITSAELQLLVYEQILEKEKKSIDDQINSTERETVKITDKIAILKKLVGQGDVARAELKKQYDDKSYELKELRNNCLSAEEVLRERKEDMAKKQEELKGVKEHCRINKERLEQQLINQEMTQQVAKQLGCELQQKAKVMVKLAQFDRENADELLLTRLLREQKLRRKEAEEMVKELKIAVNEIWDKVREKQTNDRMLLP